MQSLVSKPLFKDCTVDNQHPSDILRFEGWQDPEKNHEQHQLLDSFKFNTGKGIPPMKPDTGFTCFQY